MPEKICKNVWLVGSSNLTDPGDCMVYLVVGDTLRKGVPQQSVLIDAGVGHATAQIMKNVKAAAGDTIPNRVPLISAIVLTHCHIDHIGGTNEIRQLTGAKVYAHEKDAKAIEEAIPRFTVQRYYGIELDPIPVDVELPGERGEFDFAPGELFWIHTPGHTPGSMCVLYRNTEGETVLFGQDIHGPFEPGYDSSISDWRESMKKLLALEPDILCEGHFGIFQPAAQVRHFIEGYLRRHE